MMRVKALLERQEQSFTSFSMKFEDTKLTDEKVRDQSSMLNDLLY